jgi:hypothetical protein
MRIRYQSLETLLLKPSVQKKEQHTDYYTGINSDFKITINNLYVHYTESLFRQLL